jgi:uncharacterized protein (DUF1800 family)
MGPLLGAIPPDLKRKFALHALNSLGFGPTPNGVRDLLSKGIQRHIEEQLAPTPDPELESRLAAFRTIGYPIARVVTADSNSVSQIFEEFVTARLVRAVHSRNQLEEVLVDFWFNHFNVNMNAATVHFYFMAYERDAIRPHVFGRFRDLLGAVAKHAAMLFYLDNYINAATKVDGSGRLVQGINENYGRELLELHTVGVDAGYTQAHVYDAARCFTGWAIDGLLTNGSFVFRPQNHDTGAKTVLGLSLPAGGGQDDGEKLLDYLASHPATAHFVSRKLVERFVADKPPQALVDRMATAFLRSGGEIRVVLRSMIDSPEFWATVSEPAKPRTPLEFAIAALRAAGAEVTGSRGIAPALAAMGEPLYECIPPIGYSNRGVDWLNASSHLNRINFAFTLAMNEVQGADVDARAIVRRASGDPDNAPSIAASLDDSIFGRRLSKAALGAISNLSGAGPSLAARGLALVLASPEMQLR